MITLNILASIFFLIGMMLFAYGVGYWLGVRYGRTKANARCEEFYGPHNFHTDPGPQYDSKHIIENKHLKITTKTY